MTNLESVLSQYPSPGHFLFFNLAFDQWVARCFASANIFNPAPGGFRLQLIQALPHPVLLFVLPLLNRGPDQSG